MTEQFSATPSRAAVGQWSVDRYIRLLRPWVMSSGLLVIALILFRVQQLAVIAVQLIACAWIGYLVSRRGGQRLEALSAGAMTGLALGAMTGSSRFVLDPTLYRFINILFETLLLGLVGTMISVGVQTFFIRKKLSA